jgi:hypothetical protein
MLLLTGLSALTSLVAPVAYADQPVLMVVSEDADQETVPRNNRIFNRVYLALSEEMNQRGYTMVDETAATVRFAPQGRVRRTDAELIEIARAVNNPPVSGIVVFQIYASAKKSANVPGLMNPEARIAGRIIDVRGSRLLGGFEKVARDLPPLPVNCDRECILEQVGDWAQPLAGALGDALATKLENYRFGTPGLPPGPGAGGPLPGGPIPGGPVVGDGCTGFPQAFTVRLDGFNNQELTKVEEYLAAFSCFRHMRPVGQVGRRTEYWYETQTDAARLNHSLRQMLDHMGLPGQISVTGAGSVIEVVKIGTR